MQNEQPNKMTFREFLGKLSILVILIAVYVALRVLVEYGLGYKNFPFLLCAFAISFLIEAIKSKNKQVLCLVVAAVIFIAIYYVEIAWLEFGMCALGIATIIFGMRGCKSCESVDSDT